MSGSDATCCHFAYFLDRRAPHVVRLYLELRSGTVLRNLQRDPLTYEGIRLGMVRGRMELRFEACYPDKLLYSLRLEAADSPDSGAEAKFFADAGRAFDYWLSEMQITPEPAPLDLTLGNQYEGVVRETLNFEAAASVKLAQQEADTAGIACAQEAVLAKLRTGKQYRVGHKEGTTTLNLEGGVLIKWDRGEEDVEERLGTGLEILRSLRSYFNHGACMASYPHKPPEIEIWNYIGDQFQ